MRDITGLRERLNTAEHMPALLAAGRDAFDLIRAISRICQARSDEQAAAFTRAADSAIHGRNLVTTAPSMPRSDSAARLRAPAEATSLEYDLDQITGMITSLATDLADQLQHTGAPAAHARDNAACHQAAATAGHIRDLLTPLITPADTSERHGGELSSTGQSGLWSGNTACSAKPAVPGRGTSVTSTIAPLTRQDGRPPGSRTRPRKSRRNRRPPRETTMKSALFAIGIIVAGLLLTAFVMNSGKTTALSPGQPHSTHPVYCQPGPNPDC